MRSRIIDFVPDTYHRLLPDLFELPVQEERHATCNECAMCTHGTGGFPPEGFFSPTTKCCTYHPMLPNYAVGGLLLDTSDAGREGRRRVQEKIAARVGVTPFGILPPPRVHFLMKHGKAGFGQATSLICPYLDREQRACTVWAHREGECATWFCKHNNGQDGRVFWSALRDYLFEVERVLISHTLRELGFDPQRVLNWPGAPAWLDGRDLDDLPPPDARYAAAWEPWAGREAELYTTAYGVVARLDREAFARAAGVKLDLLGDALARTHRTMTSPALPDPLIKNPRMQIFRSFDDSVVLATYSSFDPTRLRKQVFDLLERFDGRTPTAAVRESIHADTGMRVSDSFIVRLYQQRILVDPAMAT
jgi:hypothetical protein